MAWGHENPAVGAVSTVGHCALHNEALAGDSIAAHCDVRLVMKPNMERNLQMLATSAMQSEYRNGNDEDELCELVINSNGNSVGGKLTRHIRTLPTAGAAS
jgi:hypothetical protein